jgi:hypothetical protein
MHGGRRKAASSIFKPPPQLSVSRAIAKGVADHSPHFPDENAGFGALSRLR